MERLNVAFNADQLRVYNELVVAGVTTQPFSEFVRDAFHDKVDTIRAARGLEVPPEILVKLTRENLKK